MEKIRRIKLYDEKIDLNLTRNSVSLANEHLVQERQILFRVDDQNLVPSRIVSDGRASRPFHAQHGQIRLQHIIDGDCGNI